VLRNIRWRYNSSDCTGDVRKFILEPNGFSWNRSFSGSETDGIVKDGTDSVRAVVSSKKGAEQGMNGCFLYAAGSPYTVAQVVINAYSLIFSTGLFQEACREWRKKLAIDKTWAHFKEHFAEAHHDLCLTQWTTQEGGYHSANNVMDSFVNETADAFANLATATALDCQMFDDLTAINKELTKQLAAKDHELVTAHSNNCNNDRSRRCYNNANYCWTHGYDVARNHTSQTCRFPREGHQQCDVNRENIMISNVSNKAKVMWCDG
jgi:hypothetical protein